MIKGFDASTLSQNELFGGKYYDSDNKQKDCLLILKEAGVNMIRLRLFNDPYDELGNSYGAGICDLNDVIKTAKRVKDLNMDWYLDLHYSDCWADPGKQRLPKAWVNYNLEELINEVYKYTKDVLNSLLINDIKPSFVSIGNEITNGFLWPLGHRDNFSNLVKLINAGLLACNEYHIKTMIHLDNGSNNELYRNWFDSYYKYGGNEFDYIGLSYYPLWHGTMNDLENNIIDIQNRYHKETIIVETSYPFTMEDYAQYEQLEQRKGMAFKKELIDKITYPVSIKGVGWASDKAIEYMQEKGPGGNEWANQALFDYDGHSLATLDVFSRY